MLIEKKDLKWKKKCELNSKQQKEENSEDKRRLILKTGKKKEEKSMKPKAVLKNKYNG